MLHSSQDGSDIVADRGYTIRTHEWRYTAWFRFSFEGARGPYPTDAPDYFGRVLVDESLGTELCK